MVINWATRNMLAAAVVADGAIVDERICVLADLMLNLWLRCERALPRRCQIVLAARWKRSPRNEGAVRSLPAGWLSGAEILIVGLHVVKALAWRFGGSPIMQVTLTDISILSRHSFEKEALL